MITVSSLTTLPFTPDPQYTDLKAVQSHFVANFFLHVIGSFGPAHHCSRPTENWMEDLFLLFLRVAW